jgi:hemoglobin-like flavoprotein/ABC-type transporter Mla MlaB component
MARNKKSRIGFDPLAWLDEGSSNGEPVPAGTDAANNDAQVDQTAQKQSGPVKSTVAGKDSGNKTARKKTAGRKTASTVKQIQLLGQTLDETALLKGYQLAADKLDSIVEDFYTQLFSQHPEVQPLFAHSDQVVQGKKLREAIQLLLDHLHQPAKLEQTLQDLGRRHQAYGALPEHYPQVVELLLASFKQQLGRRWTRAINAAWQTLLNAASTVMCAAYDDAYQDETEIATEDTASSEQQTSIESDESQPMRAESLLELQAIQDISQSAALKAELLALLDKQQTIQIDASRVERIDGTALQLLCALFVEAENNNVSLQWVEPSQALLQAAKYSGLTSLLNLPG